MESIERTELKLPGKGYTIEVSENPDGSYIIYKGGQDYKINKDGMLSRGKRLVPFADDKLIRSALKVAKEELAKEKQTESAGLDELVGDGSKHKQDTSSATAVAQTLENKLTISLTRKETAGIAVGSSVVAASLACKAYDNFQQAFDNLKYIYNNSWLVGPTQLMFIEAIGEITGAAMLAYAAIKVIKYALKKK